MEKESGTVEQSEAFSLADYQTIRQYFNTGNILKRACRETCLDYPAVRRNLNGPPQNLRLVYGVLLREWVSMWCAQESERKALAAKHGVSCHE